MLQSRSSACAILRRICVFRVRHYKLFYQDTMCVDLQTHLALSLCTGEMGHTKRRKKSEAEKFTGSK